MKKHFFWIDLEMSGLDEKVYAILEVATIVTDTDFNIIEEYHEVVFQPLEVLAKMDVWCQKQHGESGLTEAAKRGCSLSQVEQKTINLINKYFSEEEKVVICGNSVGNDRRFIDKYMPTLAQRLHYRIIDVSSFKEIFRQRFGFTFEKKNNHRALEDLHESIQELKTYVSHIHV